MAEDIDEPGNEKVAERKKKILVINWWKEVGELKQTRRRRKKMKYLEGERDEVYGNRTRVDECEVKRLEDF